MIKNHCYDIYKGVILAINENKQYSENVPSQHVSDFKQSQLRKKTKRSVRYRQQFKKITERLSHEYDDDELLETLKDQIDHDGQGQLVKQSTTHIHDVDEEDEEECITEMSEDEEKANGDEGKGKT